MARYRYQMYCDGLPSIMHRSNDLDELIRRVQQLEPLFRGMYDIRDFQGTVVWKGDKND